MTKNHSHRFFRSGFTLAEISIMAAVGTLLFLALLNLLSTGMRGTQHGMEKLEGLQELSSFLNRLSGELALCRKINNLTADTFEFQTSAVDVATGQRIGYNAIYSFSGEKLEYTPSALTSTLPPYITSKILIHKNLESPRFEEVTLITPSGELKGLRVQLKLKNSLSKGELRFSRSFFPPLLPENNRENPYQHLLDKL